MRSKSLEPIFIPVDLSLRFSTQDNNRLLRVKLGQTKSSFYGELKIELIRRKKDALLGKNKLKVIFGMDKIGCYYNFPSILSAHFQ